MTDSVRTRGHTDLAERARRVLPGGATHTARTYDPRIYVQRSSGSRKWLVDGTEMIDYTMGHGALLLGHAYPTVVAALREQMTNGTHYGAAHPLEVEWAELIVSMVPSAEKVRFTASGTEAAMLALRVARVATGRDRIVKLQEHFHGWSDVVSPYLDADGVERTPPGVPDALGALTTVVPADDPAALLAALAGGDVAAVIFEASGAHYGQLPLAPSFISMARDACSATGTLLVFDEVVSGFRVAPGGMQEVLGILSGPERDRQSHVRGNARRRRGRPWRPPGAARHHHSPPRHLEREPSQRSRRDCHPRDHCQRRPAADRRGLRVRLEAEWTGALAAAGINGEIRRYSSILHVLLDDPRAQARIANEMRIEGVDLLNASAFCSSVHTAADLDQTAGAFARAVRRRLQPRLTTGAGELER